RGWERHIIDEGLHAQGARCGHVVWPVVDVDDLIRGAACGANARLEELNSGLPCTNPERQHQVVERPQDRLELPAEPLEVELVGVARQHESSAAALFPDD